MRLTQGLSFIGFHRIDRLKLLALATLIFGAILAHALAVLITGAIVAALGVLALAV